jgi:uncharacterized protein (DUF1697 family)
MLKLKMNVVVTMLRGVNVGGHNRIKMDALRALYESLRLRDAATCIQSGNVVFRSDEPDLVRLAGRIERGIERTFGFRPAVIVRTASELRGVIANNPFSTRRNVDPSKLLVFFLASDPGPDARDTIQRIKADPEELRIAGRELYIHFPNGAGRSKLPIVITRAAKTPMTSRNWNIVTKLLQMAEALEAAGP